MNNLFSISISTLLVVSSIPYSEIEQGFIENNASNIVLSSKDKLILKNSYNKFIEKKARLELGSIDRFKPSNTLFYCIEQCKQKYPMSEITLEKSTNNS